MHSPSSQPKDETRRHTGAEGQPGPPSGALDTRRVRGWGDSARACRALQPPGRGSGTSPAALQTRQRPRRGGQSSRAPGLCCSELGATAASDGARESEEREPLGRGPACGRTAAGHGASRVWEPPASRTHNRADRRARGERPPALPRGRDSRQGTGQGWGRRLPMGPLGCTAHTNTKQC